MECAIVVFLLATMLTEDPGRDPNVLTFVFFTIMARRGLLREPELHTTPTPCLNGKDCRQLAAGPALGGI
jgi:hypothetical protein